MSRRVLVSLGAVVLLLGACRGQVHEEPPIHPIRNMYQQPRYNPQAASEFFADGRAMRPLVPGTVAREMEPELPVATGLEQTRPARYVRDVPQQVVRRLGGSKKMLERGRSRYEIYCAPCHGLTGAGDGLVAQRAVKVGAATLKPPSFHQERIRSLPDGHVYAVITNGVRNMPAYRHSVPLDDRWAIVAYVRALQLTELSRKSASLDRPGSRGEVRR